jgi:hypothetical protein
MVYKSKQVYKIIVAGNSIFELEIQTDEVRVKYSSPMNILARVNARVGELPLNNSDRTVGMVLGCSHNHSLCFTIRLAV